MEISFGSVPSLDKSIWRTSPPIPPLSFLVLHDNAELLEQAHICLSYASLEITNPKLNKVIPEKSFTESWMILMQMWETTLEKIVGQMVFIVVSTFVLKEDQ